MSRKSKKQSSKLGAVRKPVSYTVDGVLYATVEGSESGALLRARMPETTRRSTLFLEGRGTMPDTVVKDDTTVNFNAAVAGRFYTVPTAVAG